MVDDGARRRRRRYDRTPPSKRDHAGAGSGREDDGGERIIPLTKRHVASRLDVFPFVVCYALLIALDIRCAQSPSSSSSSPSPSPSPSPSSSSCSATMAMFFDLSFLSLLLMQLLTFLKCQWDPTWRARIGYYRRHHRHSRVTSSSISSKSSSGTTRRKVEDMYKWTHCLVVPRSSFDVSMTARAERPGIVPVEISKHVIAWRREKGARGEEETGGKEETTTMATTKTTKTTKMAFVSHVASIRFRGWTYRCCINQTPSSRARGGRGRDDDHPDEHVDWPMESIWIAHDDDDDDVDDGCAEDGEDDEGHDDRDGENLDDEIDASLTRVWEPRFHRLHFPIDLPLDFYARRWKGHRRRDEDADASDDAVPSDRIPTLDAALAIYGDNATDIPLPPYLSLLRQQLIQPMFLFQTFCVLLWCLDEYWIYSIYTLCSLLMFECVQAYSRYKSVRRLREDAVGGSVDGYIGGENVYDDDGKDAVECYRMGSWITVPARRLVVGDVVSLVSPSSHRDGDAVRGGGRRSYFRQGRRRNNDRERGFAVPADLLLLGGRAVVNEAMLTGESVPQVKESIGVEGCGTTTRLDLSDDGASSSAHSRCVLFGGTMLMDHHSSEEDDEEEEGNGLPKSDVSSTGGASSPVDAIPPPPNRGLMCFVLRTGFDTVQGQLLRTMAYHAEAGGGGGGDWGGGDGVNAMETLYFLLILLSCALASAATVVDHAWGDVTRNHYKLVLHVVIIITSVIPPELPMELSLAVTQSLAELIKRYQIYCTEPFRIPLAGLVDTCCFDKTGTLTSDILRLHGVRLPHGGKKKPRNSDSIVEADDDLILFDDMISKAKLTISSADKDDGDDTKMSSIDTIRSLLPRDTLRVMVGCQSLATTNVFIGRGFQMALCGDPLEKAVMEGCGFTIHPRTGAVVEQDHLLMDVSSRGSIKVLHRFGFSSKLRRMTVLALDSTESPNNTTNSALWALTKGAPEALKPMFDPSSLPVDYEEAYLRHMTLGRRVLALAYRDLGKNTPENFARWKSSRESVEDKLKFAGLLVLDSPLKADSARVIRELRSGNQNVVMVTGDALLTAAEVARRVGIVDAPQECTYELCYLAEAKKRGQFVFLPLARGIGAVADVPEQLVYTPSKYSELAALVRDGKANFCVSGDILTKLAYHAIEVPTVAGKKENDDDRTVLNHPAAKLALSRLVPLCTVFARHAPRHKEAVIAAFIASGRHTLMCGDGTNDVGALKQAHVGVSIISVPDFEAKQRSANGVISAVKAEERRERKAAKSSSTFTDKTPKRKRAKRIEQSLQDLAEAENELNFVSLGNASVASPFTSRKTSIRCCKDILAQGRCTLVTMIQIYKILGVQCLVNALVLSTLHQKGVKQGDRQLTAVGLVVAILFLFVTRGKPLPKLSTTKPPSSVLSRETLLSMAVQFSIHFLAIMAVTFISNAYVDPYDPSIVPDGPFHPNTLNTGTFLITVLSTINTFVVNYQGKPHMEDLTENTLLFRSVQACYFVLFVCASEAFPPLNQLMQLSPLPSTAPPTFNLCDGSECSRSIGHYLLLEAVETVGFRTMLCVVMSLDTFVVTMAEKTIRSLPVG